MTDGTVFAIGGDVIGEGRGTDGAGRAFAGKPAVVTGVAPADANGGVTRHPHGVGRKARRRVGVAAAALNASHRNMRGRLQAGGGRAIVAARAIGVGRRVGKRSTRPAGEGRSRTGVTGDTIPPTSRDVAREGCCTDRAARSLTGEGAVVTGVAPAGIDGGVTRHAHGVGRKTRRRVGVAAAALNTRNRNMRRRLHAGGGRAIVAARTISIGRCMGEFSASPARESRGRAGVTADAVGTIGWDVAGERPDAERALRSLSGKGTVVTGVASTGADGSMPCNAHGVGRKTRCRIGVAIAALNAGHRNMRRSRQTGRGCAVVAAGASGIGRCMRERSTQPRGRALMASLARQGRGHMVRGLAQRQSAVVATPARRRDPGMIHDCGTAKAHGALVAISAWCSGDNVVGRLAKSERAIVATGARSHCLGVIDEAHFPPRRGEVAAFAKIRRLRVPLHLAGSSRAVMAGETLPRRSLKAPADMA